MNINEYLLGRLSTYCALSLMAGLFLRVFDTSFWMIIIFFFLGFYQRIFMLLGFFLLGQFIGIKGIETSITEIIAGFFLPLRNYLDLALSKRMTGDSLYLARAIFFGNKGNSCGELILRRAGLGHLMAVSGLHTGIAASMAMKLSKRIKPSVNPAYSAIFGAFSIAALSGFSASSLRALFVLMAPVVALGDDNGISSVNKVVFAFFLICMLSPSQISGSGLQMSVAGYLALTTICPFLQNLPALSKYKESKPQIIRFLCEQIINGVGIGLIVMPITLYHINEYPISGFLANMVVVPLTGGVITLGAGTMILPGLLGEISGFTLHYWLEIMIWISSKIIRLLPWIYASLIPFSAVISWYLALIFWMKDSKKTALKNAFLAAFLFFVLRPVARSGIVMGDVDNGDCFLIRAKKGSLVVDCPAWGGKELRKILAYGLVGTVDLAVATHPHKDHEDGIIDLINNYRVSKVMIPGSFEMPRIREAVKNTNTQLIVAVPGKSYWVGDMEIVPIWPPENSSFQDPNDGSLVMMVRYGKKNMLFCADESKNFSNWKNMIEEEVDLIKAPHHGAYTTEIGDLINFIPAQTALISAGLNNSYGHPAQSTLDLFQKNNATIYRTDIHGRVYVPFKDF